MNERVLLIHPGIYNEVVARSYPPWGVINVGDALRRAGFDVEVADLNGLHPEAEAGRLFDVFKPTILGLTGKMGLAATRMRRIIDFARNVQPSIKIAVGGPLVSSFPDIALPLWRGVDALFWGDGEETFVKWVDSGAPPGSFLGPSEVADLDTIGIPAWWNPLHEYVGPPDVWPGLNVHALHISGARGCTRRCTFCYLNSQYPGSRFRFLSAPRLSRDIELLSIKLGITGFYFVDDCFIDQDHSRVSKFCEIQIKRGAPFRFGCDVQLFELEDRYLLEMMHKAGFRSLYLGIEAASDDVRKRLGKSRIKGGLKQDLETVMDMGFVIRASIGIGWPGETEFEMLETLELIDRVPGLVFDAYRYSPLPNVPLTKFWSRAKGSSLSSDGAEPFEDYSEYNRNYSSISDSSFDFYWEQMLVRQHQRYLRYLAPAARVGLV